MPVDIAGRIRRTAVALRPPPTLFLRPQPRGAAHAAGVTVQGFAHRRFALPAEHKLFNQRRNRFVQAVNVAHPAAENENIRIENIHHMSQRFRQPPFIAAERQFGQCVLLLRQADNFIAFKRIAAQTMIIGGESGAGNKRLNASLFSTVTVLLL